MHHNPCPTCQGHAGTTTNHGWEPCPDCYGTGTTSFIDTLPPTATPDDTFPERADVLLARCVDAAVDPDARTFTEDEWDLLCGFVGDAGMLWSKADKRGRLVQMLVDELTFRLGELSLLKRAVRRHMEAFGYDGDCADLALWRVVQPGLAGPGDADCDPED